MRFFHLLLLPLSLPLALAACGTEPCTVIENDDGTATVTCPDGSTATLRDGTAGADGTDGTDGTNGTDGTSGQNGQNGQNGADGESCTVIDNGDDTKTITCGNDSVVVSDGSTITGDVAGTISLVDDADPAGSSVSLVNRATDVVAATATVGAGGVYAFDDVSIGIYELVIDAETYNTLRIRNVVEATLSPVANVDDLPLGHDEISASRLPCA